MSDAFFDHVMLFTGHMIDALGRKAERFPARAEGAARAAIGEAIQKLLAGQKSGETTIGIAGGASGGDLLFHELCGEFSIPTLLRLALPVEEYLEASLKPAGGDWVRRFHAVRERIGEGSICVLDDTVVLPKSLAGPMELNVWQRVNLWMVNEALAIAPQQTLIALWDGKAGDGPGGTEDLIRTAPEFGIEVAPVIRTQTLLGP